MTDMMVKIMVEVLDILGTATKEMKQGRASEVIVHLWLLEANVLLETFLEKVAGKTNLEEGLKRLDNMASNVNQMANMELQKSHGINEVMENVQVVINGAQTVLE